MTNREQVAWAMKFSDYENSEVAGIIIDMCQACGIPAYHFMHRENIEKWLGLECDPETNNWGELDLPDEE